MNVFKKSIMNVFVLSVLLFVLQACMMPSASTTGSPWNGGFPSSTTETHTKTTIVSPPSYGMVNMPPPSITQAAPIVQQPMMYQAPAPQYQSNTNYAPSQVGAYDPCAYQVSVPKQDPSKYTIAIPPAPAPQYTIALPQGNPPQYAVVQQQAPVSANFPVKIHSYQDMCE